MIASDEENIYGAFAECLLVPLQCVPMYNYMNETNAYLNSCSSSVLCTLGCGTVGYLVLTAQPSISDIFIFAFLLVSYFVLDLGLASLGLVLVSFLTPLIFPQHSVRKRKFQMFIFIFLF